MKDGAKPRALVGAVLAAGRGKRMYPFSANLPKPLLPVCNRPLISYQLDEMRALGIKDVFVVVGHCGHEIVRALGDGESHGVNLHYVEQREMKGIAHAVGTLEPLIENRVLLFLGDIYFETTELSRMIEMCDLPGTSAVLATKYERDADAIRRNFAVLVDGQNVVTRVIEKPRYAVSGLKGCGLYLFDQHIFDAIRRTPRTAMRDEYELTEAIQILIDDGYAVRSAPVVGRDINLTCPGDLLKVNLAMLTRRHMDACVGKDSAIDETATVRDSVVGHRTKVGPRAQIERSVLMDGATVPGGQAISDSVVIGRDVIPCGRTLPGAI